MVSKPPPGSSTRTPRSTASVKYALGDPAESALPSNAILSVSTYASVRRSVLSRATTICTGVRVLATFIRDTSPFLDS